MTRTSLALGAAFALGLLSPALPGTRAQPNPAKEIVVLVKAQLYEVDDAFYKQVARAKRLSKDDLEELERQALNPPKGNPPKAPPLPGPIEKQKLVLAGKEVAIDPGKDGVVFTASKAVNCLPSPEQIRQGLPGPQPIQEGVSLRVRAHVSADRRFVRARFSEASQELEGVEKVKVVAGPEGREVVAEVAFVKEGGVSQVRDIPDGGALLLPLQYRPRAVRENDRWLVAQVVPRIWIAEEERIRNPGPGPGPK